MEEKIKLFREYLEKTIQYYENGGLCSWGESVHGKDITSTILNKFDEIFKDKSEIS